MPHSVIVSACRTPLGSFLGRLSPLSAPALGSLVIREVVSRAGIELEAVDEVILGQVLQAGSGQAPARAAALGAGLPESVGAYSVNKVCGSGLKAVMLADQAIRAGDAKVVVAGGVESMSNAPYLLTQARSGMRMGHGEVVDSLIRDGLWDALHDRHMASHCEQTAREHGISRRDADEWAYQSHTRALSAREAGCFDEEVVPVDIPEKRGSSRMTRDETPRETSREALAGLRTAFEEDGIVTAGNSSKISDGGAAVLVMAEDEARRRGIRPLARIMSSSTHSQEPSRLMMAPERAIRECLRKAGWSVADLYEINEPFAAAAVALARALQMDWERVNVRGGAVALGHPIGATGCRMLVTLLHILSSTDRRGVAALCLGGGEAVAMAVERLT